MSIIQTFSKCCLCGGTAVTVKDIRVKDIETTCTLCGAESYEQSTSTYKPRSKQNMGHGTYHVHYKNGDMIFGCFNERITGKDVESFIQFIDNEPCVDTESCSLVRFERGVLEAIIGLMPELYSAASYSHQGIGGEQYA